MTHEKTELEKTTLRAIKVLLTKDRYGNGVALAVSKHEEKPVVKEVRTKEVLANIVFDKETQSQSFVFTDKFKEQMNIDQNNYSPLLDGRFWTNYIMEEARDGSVRKYLLETDYCYVSSRLPCAETGGAGLLFGEFGGFFKPNHQTHNAPDNSNSSSHSNNQSSIGNRY